MNGTSITTLRSVSFPARALLLIVPLALAPWDAIAGETCVLAGGWTCYYSDENHFCSRGHCCTTDETVGCGAGVSDCCPTEHPICYITANSESCYDTCPGQTCGNACCGRGMRCLAGNCVPEPPPINSCEGQAGDPVDITKGSSRLVSQDVALSNSRGGANELLTRHFTSNLNEWLGERLGYGVPKPFGSAPWPDTDTLLWWLGTATQISFTDDRDRPLYVVRLPNGRLLHFFRNGSVDNTHWPAPYGPGLGAEERLYRDAAADSFTLYRANGERWVYDVKFRGQFPLPDGGTTTRDHYFLRRILTGQGDEVASLIYTEPGSANCVTTLDGGMAGAAYVAEIRTPEQRVVLEYTDLQRPDSSWECVLSTIGYRPLGSDAGSAKPSVAYAYAASGPGRLASVTWKDSSGNAIRSESFYYDAGIFVRSEASQPVMEHDYSGGVVTTAAPPHGELLSLAYYGCTSSPCDGGSDPEYNTAQDLNARAGDATDAGSDFVRTFEVLPRPDYETDSRPLRITDSCNSAVQSCSPGTREWRWTSPTGGVGTIENYATPVATQNKRGVWEVSQWNISASGTGGTYFGQKAKELTRVFSGASFADGGGYLEETRYTYDYSDAGVQLLITERERSVVSGGSDVVTTYKYDSTSARPAGVIRSGWIRDVSGNTPARHVGTFYFTDQPCSGGGTADPRGRVKEVQGPCFVADATRTNCSADNSSYPVTQYDYYDGTATGFKANRLWKVRRYTALSSGTCSTAYLETEFKDYDALGNPLEIYDVNNAVTTTLQWAGSLLKKETVTASGYSSATEYAYDTAVGKLTSIKYPDGHFEVFSYRDGSGTYLEKLQWKARSPNINGTSYTERIDYEYWDDGTLKSETAKSASGEVRSVKRYSRDALRRLTWEQWGSSPAPDAGYASASAYDRADNRVGVSLPYNNAPAWCGGVPSGADALTESPTTKLCAHLSYDRADRLEHLKQFESTTASAIDTWLSYDEQGNVCSVTVGGTDAGTCTPSGTDWRTYYQHDDFGNVVAVHLPNTGNASAKGIFRYEYSAAGDVVKKTTPTVTSPLTYNRDLLGRLTTVVDATAGTLYTLSYDSPAGTAYCPALSFTKGRLASQEGAIFATCYSYDPEGRVTHEYRMRNGYTTCGSGANDECPSTAYTWDAGRLATITYPHGRVITYTYGSGGAADRVASVSMSLFAGGTQTIASNVAWEPYGGLRGYQMTFGASDAGAVEYMLGDMSAYLPTTGGQCPSDPPSQSTDDETGRLRSLRVGTGAFTPGTNSGDIYKRTYTWRGDFPAVIDTCYLGLTYGSREDMRTDNPYGITPYDGLGRLHFASPYADYSAYRPETYFYDGRGNRTSFYIDEWSNAYNSYYDAGVPLQDQMTSLRSTFGPSTVLRYDYTYTAEGAVASKVWPNDSTQSPNFRLDFTYAASADAGTSGAEGVFRTASRSGAVYNYYYDPQSRRVRKAWPNGVVDEYFYDTGHQLLEDRGTSTGPNEGYAIDEYIWLGGRPIAMMRDRFDNTWWRYPDGWPTCPRNGENAPCEVTHLVTDHIGKPVLALDMGRRIAGVGEYNPFGRMNRRIIWGETAHPYGTSGVPGTLGYATAAPLGMLRDVRVHFAYMDTQPYSCGGSGDPTYIYDWPSGNYLAGPYQGQHYSGDLWSAWVNPSSWAQVVFQPNTENYSWSYSFGCRHGKTQVNYNGVAIDGYEYRRQQSGATPRFTPLRFPGQYYDAETDLNENWHRYYDFNTGRYLSTEPMLQEPPAALIDAMGGRSMPAYAYAYNNPLAFFDPDGLKTRTKREIDIKICKAFGLKSGGCLACCIKVQEDDRACRKRYEDPNNRNAAAERCMEAWDENLNSCRMACDRKLYEQCPKPSPVPPWKRPEPKTPPKPLPASSQ